MSAKARLTLNNHSQATLVAVEFFWLLILFYCHINISANETVACWEIDYTVYLKNEQLVIDALLKNIFHLRHGGKTLWWGNERGIAIGQPTIIRRLLQTFASIQEEDASMRLI